MLASYLAAVLVIFLLSLGWILLDRWALRAGLKAKGACEDEGPGCGCCKLATLCGQSETGHSNRPRTEVLAKERDL